LLVIDTRAGRILADGHRSMIGDAEFEWAEENAEGDLDQLLIGSSLPWLMPNALSHVQSATSEPVTGRDGAAGSPSGCGRPPTWSTAPRSGRPSTGSRG
jgi:hypothetical protein